MSADVDIVGDLADGSHDAAPSISHVDTSTRDTNGGGDAVGVAAAGTVATQHVAKAEPRKHDNLRDMLSQALKGEKAPETGQEAAQGQQRGPDGKFLPKQADAAQSGPVADQSQAQQQGGAQQPAAAPANLPPEVAAQFTSLPAETQSYIARTMADAEALSQRVRGYDALESIIGPRREAWLMGGMTPEVAVQQLFALSDFAGRTPDQFISWFAGQHGIDLGILAEGGDAEDEIDPTVRQLQQQVQQLTGQLSHFTQGQQQQHQAAVIDEIEKFGKEAGQDGNALRPYFDELTQSKAILPYIEAARAENPGASNREVLATAYDRACWATPAIREKLLAAQEATRLAGLRQTSARAQAAGSSVTGAPASDAVAKPQVGTGTVRDEVRRAFAAHSQTV